MADQIILRVHPKDFEVSPIRIHIHYGDREHAQVLEVNTHVALPNHSFLGYSLGT